MPSPIDALVERAILFCAAVVLASLLLSACAEGAESFESTIDGIETVSARVAGLGQYRNESLS